MGWSKRRVLALHEAYIEHGHESPFKRWFEGGFPDDGDRFTTHVDVGEYLERRRAALLAHRTQVDPDGFWMKLPDEVIRGTFPWEEYVLARSLVDGGVPAGEPAEPETDLFAGVRAQVGTRR